MIRIDYQSKLPRDEQIAKRFHAIPLRDALPPGGQMASVLSLALDLSINPTTIKKAFSLLEQRGYIYPVRGRGNYVADTARLAEQEKASFLKEVNHLLIQGKELVISRKEFIAVVDILYGKEDTND